MELKREMMGGIQCVIEVDVNGRFAVAAEARDNPNAYLASYCTTLDEALGKAKRELGKRKVKLDIPFITAAGERGIATGRHSATGYVLARVGGVSMQLSGYSERLVFPGDVDPEVVERYLKAEADKRDAEQRVSAIKSDEMIDLDKVVEAAIEEHVRGADAEQTAVAAGDVRRD